jgi:nucleotide-binding universal stress UspA family protein
MYKTILVPLDGSTLSEGILPYVRILARGIHVPVELLKINDPRQLAPYAPPLQGGEYLEKVAVSISAITDVKCTVELGNPAARIIDLAAAQPDTLIAMATHGYSGPQRWLLGSVAEKILHAATNNLLVVRPTEGDTGGEARLRTVVVPLDGSELAEKVLPIVTALAACLSLEVILVHVLIRFLFRQPEAFLPVFGANIPNQQELWVQAGSEAKQYLTGMEERLRAQGLAHVSSSLIEGSAQGAAAEIIDLARKTSDNLVAMSTHGRSGVGRWLIGSVAERVVRHSNDPVLVIRPLEI